VKSTEQLPLRLVATDPDETFQLRFAKRAEPLVSGLARVSTRASKAGLELAAESERDLTEAMEAIRRGIPSAKESAVEVVYLNEPQPMEPHVRVRVAVPEDFYGDAVRSLNLRSGTIEAMEDATDGRKVVIASAPLAKILG